MNPVENNITETEVTPVIPDMSGRLPFRLGTSSYIIPADIEPNVRALAPLIDDIELVIFESDEFSNLPDKEIVRNLAEIKGRNNLSFTVHLPLDSNLGDPDEAVREASVGKCARVFERVCSLEPHAYLLHLHGEKRGNEPAKDIGKWQKRLSRSVETLISEHGFPAHKVAVETLDYPFDLAQPIIREYGLSVCVDVGHLLLAGRDPIACINDNRRNCRVIHLHGVRQGKDHVDIADMDTVFLNELNDAVADGHGPECVVTLEVFDKVILQKCVAKLAGIWL